MQQNSGDLEEKINNRLRLAETPEFHIREEDGLVIFPQLGFWLLGSPEQAKMLWNIINNPSEISSDMQASWARYLTSEGITRETAQFQNRKTITDSILSVGITLTNRCNLLCLHCYQGSGPANTAQGDVSTGEVIDFLEFLALKYPPSVKYVQLSGGEIFMRPDLFDVIQAALDIGYQVRLSTNGILINKLSEEQMNILANQNIHPRVSIDGPDPETHGVYRPANSFRPALNGFKRLAEANPNAGIKTA